MSKIGGWKVEVAVNELPQKVATGFTEVFGNIIGAKYTPLIYAGSQVVHGINHAVIAEQTLTNADADKSLVLTVLNEKPIDEGKSGFSGVYIVPLVEGGKKYGGTDIVDSFKIPEDAQAAFDDVLKGFVGSSVELLLYVGSKVVNGIEFKFIVKVTPVVPDADPTVKVLTVNTRTKDIFFEDIFS